MAGEDRVELSHRGSKPRIQAVRLLAYNSVGTEFYELRISLISSSHITLSNSYNLISITFFSP